VSEEARGFEINPGWEIRAYTVGREQEPVLVIDKVLAEPQALVEAAAAANFGAVKPGGNFYPGLRTPAPKPYVRNLHAALRPVIAAAFGLPSEGMIKMSSALSLATLKPQELAPAQRLPHFDTADGGQIAVLHYLCGPEHGGTAFYRHRATGFETVTPGRLAAYVAALEAETAARPPAQDYIRGDTELFEQIGRVEAAFDRVAVYRSHLLHAGDMGPSPAFSSDARHGRLTANTFLFF